MYIMFKDWFMVIRSSSIEKRRSYVRVGKSSIYDLIGTSEDLGLTTFRFKELDNEDVIYTLTIDSTKELPYIEIENIEVAKVLYGSST